MMNKKVSRVVDIFDVHYGLNLELNALEKDSNGINFVSRTSKNNGVSARVKMHHDVTPIPAGTISVAAGGAYVMESFLQPAPYYSGRDLYYLVPRIPLSTQAKLYYCVCLKCNRFRFSYGRQANSTLEELLVPPPEEIPKWVKEFSVKQYATQLLSSLNLKEHAPNLHPQESNKLVPLSELFTTVNGIASSELKRFPEKLDNTYVAYLRPSYRQNTSIDAFVSKGAVDIEHIFAPGSLYVSTDGQGSHTYAYVSVFEFVPNSNITVLIPKRAMNLQEKLYYAECITHNRFKFSYGRKPKGNRLKAILLPEYVPLPINAYSISKILSEFSNVVDNM
jgi:hypothetical protein